tara:strand:- start:1630 stop:5181 length:3552 start_codon:yes stop_codon:yes gene_type:complete
MAENNQNELTYKGADTHSAKKGRPKTYALLTITDNEAAGFTGINANQNLNFQGGLSDSVRKNLFSNDYPGDPLSKNYSYAGFTTSTGYPPPVITLKRNPIQNGGVVLYETYNLRAHKKFALVEAQPKAQFYSEFSGDPVYGASSFKDIKQLSTFEVLLPNNKINLNTAGSSQPVIDEFTYNFSYYSDVDGVSFDFIGEYRPADGIIDFITPANSLINLPSKLEFIYCAIQVPSVYLPLVDDTNQAFPSGFKFFAPDSKTSAEEKARRNFFNNSHANYCLFGNAVGGIEQTAQNIKGIIKNSPDYFKLSSEDKDFVETEEFIDALEDAQGAYFDVRKVYEHVDFISNIPFSPKMVEASGIAVEKMLTANITSEFNFMPPQLLDIVSSNNFLELEMPNFYNFMTIMVATKEKKFDPQMPNTLQLTLNNRIDPTQLLFVGKQYDDYQAVAQLPPGHAHWDYDNNKSLLDTDFNVQGIDYWQAWAANWPDYNNEKAIISFPALDVKKIILVPFENTNFLTDYNDNISYFPMYNQIEFDSPKETPFLPQLLRSAKADRYIMRCLAASVQSIRNGTDEDFELMEGFYGQNNTQAEYDVAKYNPPGESADYFINKDTEVPIAEQLAGVGYDDYTPWYAQGMLDDVTIQGPVMATGLSGPPNENLVSWELPMLLNGFKVGSDGWLEGTFDDFDKKALYVGQTTPGLQAGLPDDLSKGSSNQKFTKSLYAHILEKQLQAIAAQKFVPYADLQCGSKNYSEIIMYRIHKKNTQDVNGETEQDIWMWNTGDVDRYVYYDTQISYGHSYEYRVYAYHLVIGNRYIYERPDSATGILGLSFTEGQTMPGGAQAPGVENFGNNNSTDKIVYEIGVRNQVTLKIIETPYFGFNEETQKTVTSSDFPPVPPDVEIVTFKNTADIISITLKNNSGEIETNKINELMSERPEAKDSSGEIVNYLFASDSDVKALMLQAQNKIDTTGAGLVPPSLKFKSDTLPAFYEIFRIGPEPGETETKPPVSYASFFDKLHSTIEVDGSSMTTIDEIQENVAYYYTFRARDGAAGYFFSNPTAVYKVQMVKEPGKDIVYPIVEIYDMNQKTYKMPSKEMTRYMHIKPNYEHTVYNDYLNYESVSKFKNKTTANQTNLPDIPKLGINNDNYELFSAIRDNAKRFKIRLTSKSTGRKIDFNVAFLRKHNQD